MLYEVQLWFTVNRVFERIVVRNTAILPLCRLEKEKCCLLYNNLESGAGIRRGMLYLVQDFSGIPENAPPTANGRFIGNVKS